MDIRSHEIIDRRRDLATENGNNGGGNVTVSSISNEDNCNGGNTNTHSQTLDQPKSQSQSQSQSQLISKSTGVRYRECLKNHAASVGGSVHDGCGEFMPSGEEGSIEALRCAACDCHRNFHRKEIEGIDGINHHRSYHHQYGGGGGRRLTPPSGMNMMLNPLMLPPPPSYPPLHHHHHHHSHKYGMNSPGGGGGMVTPMSVAYGGGGSGGGGGGGGGGGAESSSEDLNLYGQSSGEQGGVFQMSKKRFRTKFTMDQKERMMEFAEKLGWRMNKQDEEELKRFCGEIGVKRQVFKVWMHNNKNNAKKHLLPSPPLI